jgi:hypothetical protein
MCLFLSVHLRHVYMKFQILGGGGDPEWISTNLYVIKQSWIIIIIIIIIIFIIIINRRRHRRILSKNFASHTYFAYIYIYIHTHSC